MSVVQRFKFQAVAEEERVIGHGKIGRIKRKRGVNQRNIAVATAHAPFVFGDGANKGALFVQSEKGGVSGRDISRCRDSSRPLGSSLRV